MRPTAGSPRPQPASLAYTDPSGTHRILPRGVPDSLCAEIDVGDSPGNAQTNLACYRIRSEADGTGGLPTSRTNGGADIELEADSRFGVVEVRRLQPREVCAPVEIPDRGR